MKHQKPSKQARRSGGLRLPRRLNRDYRLRHAAIEEGKEARREARLTRKRCVCAVWPTPISIGRAKAMGISEKKICQVCRRLKSQSRPTKQFPRMMDGPNLIYDEKIQQFRKRLGSER